MKELLVAHFCCVPKKSTFCCVSTHFSRKLPFIFFTQIDISKVSVSSYYFKELFSVLTVINLKKSLSQNFACTPTKIYLLWCEYALFEKKTICHFSTQFEISKVSFLIFFPTSETCFFLF